MGGPGRTADPSERDRIMAVLTAEHASLNTTRSTSWMDSASRVGTFLGALGAGTVALGLLSQATGFGADFLVAVLLILGVVLILGTTTYLRLMQLNVEDLVLVATMNRIRQGYLDLAPGAAPYLSTSTHDDEAGVFETLTLGIMGPVGGSFLLQTLSTTPAVVAIVDSVLASIVAGAALLLLGVSEVLAIILGVAAGVAVLLLLLAYGARSFAALSAQAKVTSRYPTPMAITIDGSTDTPDTGVETEGRHAGQAPPQSSTAGSDETSPETSSGRSG